MAKWVSEKKFQVGSKTIGDNQIKATFDLESGVGHFEQDLTPYLDKAKEDRNFRDHHGHRKDGYRKFATIPDTVALKILEDHKLDLHDPAFMSNPANLTKLKKIMISEYKNLVINT